MLLEGCCLLMSTPRCEIEKESHLVANEDSSLQGTVYPFPPGAP